MKLKIWIPLILALILTSTAGFASASGETALSFLKIGVGARGPAMADAITALTDDATTAYWNPGGLGYINQGKLSLLQTNWLVDTSFQNISYIVPTERGGTWATYISYLNYGAIQGYDTAGAATQNLTPYDMCIGLAWGTTLTDYISFGLTVKQVSEKLEDTVASAYAVDIGSIIKTSNEKLTFGAVIQNMGSKVKFVSAEADLPLVMKVGMAYRITQDGHLTIDLDAPKEQNKVGLNLGFEQWFGILSVRLGYRGLSGVSSNIMGGIGLKATDFQLDYAYVPYGDLGGTHRLSLAFDLGEPILTRDVKLSRLFKKGVKLYEAKQYQDAVSEFLKVLELSPNHIEAQNYLNKSFDEMQKVKLEEAQKEFKEHYSEALRLLSLQEYENAKDELEKALELDPDNEEANELMKKLELIIRIKRRK